jgi:hypothetical protein
VAPLSGPLHALWPGRQPRPVRLPTSRLGWLATIPYFTLLVAAVAYLLFRMAVAPAASDLAAVPLVVLALPWSIVGISLGESVGFWIGFVVGLVINAAICYQIGWAAERKRRGTTPF